MSIYTPPQEDCTEPLTDEEVLSRCTPKDFTYTDAYGREVDFSFSVECTTCASVHDERIVGIELYSASVVEDRSSIELQVNLEGIDEEGTPALSRFHVEWNGFVFTSKDYASQEVMQMDMRIAAGKVAAHLCAESDVFDGLTEKFGK